MFTFFSIRTRLAFPVLHNRAVKQVASLYGSLGVSLILGIAVSVFNTRILLPEVYGDFKYLQSFWRFFMTFMSGGIFIAGGRMLAKEKNEAVRRELTGALSCFGMLQIIGFGLLLFILSWPQEKIFGNTLGPELRFIAPFAAVVVFRQFMEQTLKGDNRIFSLAAYRILPLGIYLLLGTSLYAGFPFGLRTTLFLTLLSMTMVFAGILWTLKPIYKNISSHFQQIWQNTRVFGLQVWLGSLFNNTTVLLTPLSLSFFHDNLSVGFFSLAMTLGFPLRFIPASVGVALFKKFAGDKKITAWVIWATTGLTVLAFVCFVIALHLFFPYLYSQSYLPALLLCKIVALGASLQGLGGFFNNFLCAQGFGKSARDASFAQGVVNLIGCGILIPLQGSLGAALTILISGGVYFTVIVLLYRKETLRPC